MKKKVKKTKKAPKKEIRSKSTSKNTLLPLGDRILLRPFGADEIGERTPSGIIIPDTVSKEKPEQGEVVAVGEGKWQDGKRIPLSVKVGDKIIFSKYGYDEIKHKGVEYYILREESILAIIK